LRGGFLRFLLLVQENRYSDSGKDSDNDDNNEEFNEGESEEGTTVRAIVSA
jgi:hypothetical protein